MSKVIGGQVVFQILGFAASVLIVRNTSIETYGQYTIILSIQMLITALSSSGIMAGFQKLASSVWENDAELSKVFTTASSVRRAVFIGAAAIAIAYGSFAFANAGMSLWVIVLSLIACVALALPSIYLPFVQYIFLLKTQIKYHQAGGIIDRTAKVILVASLLFFSNGDISLFWLVLVTLIPAYLALSYSLRKAATVIAIPTEPDPNYKSVMFSFMKRNWHNAVFYAFKGQLAVLLLALLGSVEQVGSLGGLTRYTLAISMVAVVFNSTLTIGFAKTKDIRRAKLTYTALAVFITVGAFLFLWIASLMAGLLLSILGPEYSGLEYELMLTLISGFLALLGTVLNGMNTSRGWIHYSPFLEIPFGLGAIAISALLFNLSSLEGVLYMAILTFVSMILLAVLNAIHGFNHWED